MGDDGLVIIGAGLGGAKAAEGARAQGWDGPIRLCGDEQHVPYERPPLSKDVLSGSAQPRAALVHDDSSFVAEDIDLLLGAAATGIDLDDRTVELDGGRRLRFAKLVLATGSSPRRLGVPGIDREHVYTFRTADDALALRDRLQPGHRLVVVGASWIGTEVAASARQRGCEVALIDPLDTPLERVLGPEVGAQFAALHAGHGVELHMGRGVEEIAGGDAVQGVRLDDGTTLAADSVVIGIGVSPNVTLAERAGLDVDDGVLVDASLLASHPDVYAVGDIANALHPLHGARLRVEHWANALNQGLTAGANVAGGGQTYERIPYFFSDQYDMGMEYSGWPVPWDEVVFRGDPDEGAYVAFYLAEKRVVGGANVNVWDVNEHVAALVRSGEPVDVARLTDPAVDPAEWVSSA
jgi:3-phenylpropionate/trans-cinnamate dioxygenase ferredoxin reductase subunit